MVYSAASKKVFKILAEHVGLVDADKAAEISMLLDADARLGSNGEFPGA